MCMAQSLAYSLDKVVDTFRVTVAELKDIAESNDSTDTRKSKCKGCIINFENKVTKIKQIKLDANDVDEQKDDVSSEIDRLRLTNEELLLRNENLKKYNLEKDKLISELKSQLNQNESQFFDLQASDKKKNLQFNEDLLKNSTIDNSQEDEKYSTNYKDYYKLDYTTINNRSIFSQNDVSINDTSQSNSLNEIYSNVDHNEKTCKSILLSDDDAQKTPESYRNSKDLIKDWNPKIHQIKSAIHDYDQQKAPKISDYESDDYGNIINNKRNLINHPVKMSGVLNQNMEDKPKQLHVRTPIFSSNSEYDVEFWLFIIKQGFRAVKTPDENRLNAVVNFVSDLPLLILKRHIESKSNWFEFEKELKDTFRTVDGEHKINLKNFTNKRF